MLFGSAWRKAIPLSVLFFSATFIFTMLQSLKDGIVVIEMGADALPFLTTLGTLPASLAYFNFYRFTLVPHVPPQHLYFATAAPFLAFYALFAFVLYPLAPALHSCTGQWLSWLSVLPQGLAGLVAALQQWLFSLFYVAGDLWGPVMITLAFWTVADEVCTMEEAKVLYPQLGLLANLGLVGSGKFIKAVHRAVGGKPGPDGMGVVLQVLVLCMLLMAGVMFACKALINRRYLKPGRLSSDHSRDKQNSSAPRTEQQQQQQQPNAGELEAAVAESTAAAGAQPQQKPALAAAPAFITSAGGGIMHAHHRHSRAQQPRRPPPLQPISSASSSRSSSPGSLLASNSNSSSSSSPRSGSPAAEAAGSQPKPKGSKPKASWQEAWTVLGRNPKAAELTTWVVSFGIALRLFEYAFKAQLRLAAADSAAYCCALADLQSAVGMGTLALMATSKLIFKHLGWSGAALISPSVMLLLGSSFFGCCLLAQAAAAAAAAPAAAAAAAGIAAGPAAASSSSWSAAAAAAAAASAIQQGRQQQQQQTVM
ncbi:hypothetical protein OEZ85_002812 [Tetradesmus obliquus]|uniref:ADP,ATP carrier protein n=1 Tax=Tetradesmus obliquus TaxID=3088 RepID=A0ABY8TYN9_TETOB|nr:hypothetical protein OEZ85_002812 [Tetradesmus obliquus]